MDILPHIGYAVVACSLAVRDIIWLRCLSIAAAGTLITNELLMDQPRPAILFWNALFVAINAWRLFTLVYGEKTARFSQEERAVYESTFRDLTRLEFKRLLAAGAWIDAAPGDSVARQGEALDRVLLITRGRAEVRRGGQRVAEIGAGQFVGEMSFVTGEPASAGVTAIEPLRCLAWNKESLRRLFVKLPSIRPAVLGVMGVDMSHKLRRG